MSAALSTVLGGQRHSGRAAGPGTSESGGICRAQPSPLTSQTPPTPTPRCPPGLRRPRGDPSGSCPEASWELQEQKLLSIKQPYSCQSELPHTLFLTHSPQVDTKVRGGGTHQEHSLHVPTWRLTLASPRCLRPLAAPPEATGQTGGR